MKLNCLNCEGEISVSSRCESIIFGQEQGSYSSEQEVQVYVKCRNCKEWNIVVFHSPVVVKSYSELTRR